MRDGPWRTISQPACASASICARFAATSVAGAFSMDCTTTGAPPPSGTEPTDTRRVASLGLACVATRASRSPSPTACRRGARNSVSTARRLHAPKRVAGYFTSDYPVSGQMHRDFAGGRTTTNAREGAGGKTSERVARADAPSNHPNRTGGRVQRKTPESPKFASYAHLRHPGTTVSGAVERFRSRKRQVRSFL